jgi:arylsulfatase A-like enzyme
MLIMSGPGIRKSGEIEGAAIQDLAPTILHVVGLPVPSDMDGRVLVDAFEDDYMEAFPPRVVDPSDARVVEEEVSFTEEGEKEILERLRGLGYMG